MAEHKVLHLVISKVDAPVFEGEVLSVTVPGSEGKMTILPHHEAFISRLKEGTITVRKKEDSEEQHEIESGVLEVSNNQATILM